MGHDAKVVHDATRKRFAIALPEGEAELTYRLDGRVVDVDHTFVPAAARGRNLGDALMRAALAYAQAEGMTVRPSCSYAAHWFSLHPEHAASRAG